MLDWLGEANASALVGLAGGIVLGLAARLGRFCTLGAIEDLVYGGDDRRMRMWSAALGTGIAATFALAAFGWVDLASTLWLAAPWHPVSAIVGGGLFGYGMALAGNCGYGALARCGGGDIRSFVILLVMGLAAYTTVAGPFAPIRVALFPEDSGWSADSVLRIAESSGVSPALFGISIGVALLGLALGGGALIQAPAAALWSVAVGLTVAGGFAGTAWIARTGFEPVPVMSHTFSAPIGETMLYAMTASGSQLSFGIGSVAGVFSGALIGSLYRGQFRWEACEDPRELRRQILGAVLMGVGAVTALGCSIGQGLSAFSVLAVSAPVTFLAIFAGAVLGLRQLIEGSFVR